jgi:hypothetical protein
MKTMLLYMAIQLAITYNAGISGSWNVVSGNSSLSRVDFRDNGVYNCYADGQVVLTGIYTFDNNDSTLTIEDDGCFDIMGRYQVRLSGNADSMRFIVINDDCMQRRSTIQTILLTRAKNL